MRALVEGDGDVRIVYPVHPNPDVQALAAEVLGGVDRVHLVPRSTTAASWASCPPPTSSSPTPAVCRRRRRAWASPCWCLRDVTERPEAVEAGTARLVGTADRIVSAARLLLDDPSAHDAMARASNPYGDGRARVRIADAIEARS